MCCYDILGCPGWIEGVLQANAFIKSEWLLSDWSKLSRVVDAHDRDSIYSDGAELQFSFWWWNWNVIYESGTYAMDEATICFLENLQFI
jgi:3-oxoacyl-[acyl-carrier-protein] synthase-3